QQASTSHAPPSDSPKTSKKNREFGGVLKEREFSRMSFNTRINRDKKEKEREKEQLEPLIEQSIPEESTAHHSSPPQGRGNSPPSPQSRRKGSMPEQKEQQQKLSEPSTSKPTTTHVSNLNKGWIQQPASASIVTAMYPPTKVAKSGIVNQKIQDTGKKTRSRALSIGEQGGLGQMIQPPKKLSEKAKTTAFPVNMSPPGSQISPQLPIPMNVPVYGVMDRVPRPEMAYISNNNPGDMIYFQQQRQSPQMNRRKMTEIPSVDNMTSRLLQLRATGSSMEGLNNPGPSGINNNGNISSGKVLDPDSVKGRTLQAYEAQLLSDPNILARLTRLPPHMQPQQQIHQNLMGSGGSNSGSELDQSTVTVLHLPNGVP
ncbi:hypothetical protein FO519_009321, partial [Halicephalobus sp. NKZ332]